MAEHSEEITFEKVFDAAAHLAGFDFVNEEKPVVGIITPKLINRRGAVRIELRDQPDFSDVGEIFFNSLEFFVSYTNTYKDVIRCENSMKCVDLLYAPSLRKLVETLGSRAVLRAVSLDSSEVLISDLPVLALEQNKPTTKRRKFSDTATLIG